MATHFLFWSSFWRFCRFVDSSSLRIELCINCCFLWIALSNMAFRSYDSIQKIRFCLSHLVQPPISLWIYNDISFIFFSSFRMVDKSKYKFHVMSITSRMVSLIRLSLFSFINIKFMDNSLFDKISNILILLALFHINKMDNK